MQCESQTIRANTAFSRASFVSRFIRLSNSMAPITEYNGDDYMNTAYEPKLIESGRQKAWEEQGVYRAQAASESPKLYCLNYFPYPSGEGLHVGHCRNYIPTDVIARFKRMNGYNVLHPMGWDSFGEPTEQHAIATGEHPRPVTDRNTANFKRQLRLIGNGYDWSREIDSSTPEYYRWTQWFFLMLYRRGLAYRDTNWQWWCPTCATTLSSHEIEGDRCWRGHPGVTKREIPAWYFRITAYADELISGLDNVDWPEPIRLMQRNWIGRSEGVEIEFPVQPEPPSEMARTQTLPVPTVDGHTITVYTTRPDTLYGATFIVLAPEHPLVQQLPGPAQRARVEAYVEQAIRRSEIERTVAGEQKSGVFTGAHAANPINGEILPIWVADFVLPTYGTGAVMGVPAHDQRDFEFATQFDLPIRLVIRSPEADLQTASPDSLALQAAYTGPGIMVDSGPYDGLPNDQAAGQIVEQLEARGAARRSVRYRMRDWLISRQRYWGAPIPIVYCPHCGEVPVPESQLPVLLPDLKEFAPDGSGRSPLARSTDFVQTRCPNCQGAAQRETDTMGGFACSSWYFLRFPNPHYASAPFDPEQAAYWMPVDLYVGGAEHAVLHLLYARFWTMAMADEGLVSFREPFARLLNQGSLHGTDGYRMSKSRGNVITPDAMVARYGADALRLYCLFMAPFDHDVYWSDEGIRGVYRFLRRVWRLYQRTYAASRDAAAADDSLESARNALIREVSERIEAFRFNTMVSGLMEFVNQLNGIYRAGRWQTRPFHASLNTLLLLLAPVAPYLAEALWQQGGNPGSVHQQRWPTWWEDETQAETLRIAIQVDGKTRGTMEIATSWPEEQVRTRALASENVQRHLAGRSPTRIIYVPGRIVNIVTS